VAEGARLESVFTRKGNGGSNPSLSASFLLGLYLPSSSHSSAFTNPKNDRDKELICHPLVASEYCETEFRDIGIAIHINDSVLRESIQNGGMGNWQP
jgi:hypothetical protein